MSVAGNQARVFLRLARQLRSRWRTDPALPAQIQALLSADRTFGSRDRRLYRELIYTTLRYLPWIEPWLEADEDEAVRRVAWLAAETPATKAFCATFATGEPPREDKVTTLPAWFQPHCPELFSGDELEAQLRRAPLWLRLQTDDEASVLAEFDAEGWQWRRFDRLPSAVELLTEADVTKTAAYRDGRVEVQDLGSQMILAAVGILPGERWLDACAGAGGKSLQLAGLLGREGTVEAHDIRPQALEELKTRAARARLTHIRMTSRPTAGDYDGVLVDAPCSGSGTWRRSPHLKWSTTEKIIEQRTALQQSLLSRFAQSVRHGGRLVYATCSLSRRENEDTVASFLTANPEFRSERFAETFGFAVRGNGLTIMPSRHDTDGFFVASLRRR
jgi:16S rRNA (cytosine967-C5)-methyltransferase